jgi:hypothetical protein
MRIYITESERKPVGTSQWSVTIDSKNDDERTDQAVALALRALVAYGHDAANVYQSAIEEGNEHLQAAEEKE